MIAKASTTVAVLTLSAVLFVCVDAYLSQPQHTRTHKIGKRLQTVDVSPEDAMVMEGDDVTFKCHVDNMEGQVVWGKDGTDMLTVNQLVLKHKNRISVVGEAGEFDLLIRDVQVGDAGVYNCFVTKSGDSPRLKSSDAILTVV